MNSFGTSRAARGFGPYKALLQQADDFYDSGLFDIMVDARLGTIVSDDVLIGIISELYYPESVHVLGRQTLGTGARMM